MDEGDDSLKALAKKQALFMSMLSGSVCRRHIESLFLYRASPVLRKAKPAVLITVKAECLEVWKSCDKAMCQATGLRIRELRHKNGSSLLLIYDLCEIERAIRNERAIPILESFGYETGGDIGRSMELLSERLCTNEFPHEIGLFLGYPPGDVKAYIENEGKNCVCCRYWKVYEDAHAARRMWAKIDEAQSYAMDVLWELPPIHIAANLLKAV